MLSSQRKSFYQCPVNNRHTIKDKPGKKVICPYCHVEMKEVVKGIVNK